jgi:sensor histidine kinase YesM
MVAFGDLLRAAQMTGSGEVGLGEELAFVERYLRLEKMRFGDRLQSSISMSANDADARVPSLLLQPLVENAIRHGFADLENGANLSVVAERHNDTLRLEVRDNGAGLPDGRRWEELAGIGLRNTSARLQSLYGPLHRFEVSSRPGAGTTVVIELPYQAMTA